jgi:hypothetical protein
MSKLLIENGRCKSTVLVMRKRLISLFAAAALLGSVSIASAGTVTTKCDTNISISGFTQMYFDWANNQGFLGNVANPEFSKAKQPFKPAQT